MKTKLFIILLALSSTFMVAQNKLADKFFDNYNYQKASELYEKAYNDGDDSAHVLTRLGDCYYNNSDTKTAKNWYAKAVQTHEDIKPEYIIKYIQVLKSSGEYEKAVTLIEKFKTLHPDDSRVKNYDVRSLSDYEELTNGDTKLVTAINNLPFNSEYSDFGTFIHNDRFYFVSARNTENRIYKWNNEPFLNIYQTDIKTENNKKEFSDVSPLPFKGNLKKDIHDGNITLTEDGETMYFTRDNISKRNSKKFDDEGTTHLKLFKATLINNTWTDIVELPFNDEIYSTGHPALSPDDSKLYFVSDREGGLGKTDIYVVNILEDNTYSEPLNLGDKVNTSGREMFPFVSKDSTLYFSSDGRINLGLLDIFKSEILKDDTSLPVNMGAPYNSGYDDFAYFVNSDNEKGYFSSNRPGGQGSDDIYGFDAYQCAQTIVGTARDIKTTHPLNAVSVKLIDNTGKIIEEFTTTENGEYTFSVDCNNTYTVIGTKEDFKGDKKEVETDAVNDTEYTADLNLMPLIDGNQIVINPIFFDFDKWNIRTDAQYELENIVDVMRSHPNMVIKIESHTDSRGSDNYNLKLSDRRAKSTRDYIISRGIAAKRLESAIGYGETQLLNKCSNGVKCSKAEHQLNRRSYFYILKQ